MALRKPAIACSTRAISVAIASGEHGFDRLEPIEVGGQRKPIRFGPIAAAISRKAFAQPVARKVERRAAGG